MNIFQTVIDSVAASGADITDAGGFITITGLSKPIPKGSIVSARRVLAGEKRQIFTIAVTGTPGNNVTYQISVSGKSPVTGIMKTWTASYTTGAGTITAAALGAGLVASLAYTDAPFTVSGTSTITITAKSGTPNISVVSSNSTVLPVVNATVALTALANISTAGAITVGSGTPFVAGDLGRMVTINDGTTYYTGIIKTYTGTAAVTATPNPSAAMTGGNDSLFIVDNTGATLENTYAYASLPGVNLTAGNYYVIYEIDALDRLTVGNGARPDGILNKYVIYVNSGLENTWSASGFDEDLATACSTTF